MKNRGSITSPARQWQITLPLELDQCELVFLNPTLILDCSILSINA